MKDFFFTSSPSSSSWPEELPGIQLSNFMVVPWPVNLSVVQTALQSLYAKI